VVRSRFAPAPTGFLHLGHVLSAVYVWGVTRALGGQVVLRIEDHDRQRCRSEFERAILEDLDWLGFVPDAPPLSEFRMGRCAGRQSDRSSVYGAAARGLRDRGLLYACECSRKDLGPAPAPGLERRYPGTCAQKGLPEGPGFGLRVRMEPGPEVFDDVRWRRQVQDPSDQCGDLLIRDREANWTYQFCAAVDDFVQAVTLVVRGDDLLASTGRQLRLARLLGQRRPPVFLHHPLVLKPSGDKLSKSDGDTAVRDLRARGVSPSEVVGHAAFAGGLIGAMRPIGASMVAGLEGLAPFQAGARRAIRAVG
jgi:glutamyl-Q tRNA(Asp) synthetase